MRLETANKTVFFAICAAAAGMVFAMESVAATGYVASPHRRGVVRVSDGAQTASRAKRLKGASSADALPSSWDSRVFGWIGPVKNQGEIGDCWAFAACETLETQLRKAGRGDWDFSEKNMANLHGFEMSYEEGGNNDMAAAYLLRWGGAVAETNDPYVVKKSDWKTDSRSLVPAMHVQNVVWVEGLAETGGEESLKRAIMEYGAVCVSMCYLNDRAKYLADGGAYYYTGTGGQNHAVTVVGWDDAYPAAKFKTAPTRDGAWLVKNSHGASSGDGGYLHVSYCDTRFAMTSEDCAVFIPATEDEDYSAAYGYDRLGAVFSFKGDSGRYPVAAVFKSVCHEELAAIGLYTKVYPLDYSFSVWTNVTGSAANPTSGGECAYSQEGRIERAGYSTIRLDSPLPLAQGAMFSIVFENTTDAPPYYCVCASSNFSDGSPYSRFEPTEGQTFHRGGGSWFDFADDNESVCLKAYTRATKTARDAGPGETQDGSAMLAAAAAADAAFASQFSQSFGAFCGLVGVNGRTLWYSWLTGLDPLGRESRDFTLSIHIEGGVPRLEWSPDLGDGRTYTVMGAASLEDAQWREVDDLSKTDARFFKVQVAPKYPEAGQKRLRTIAVRAGR